MARYRSRAAAATAHPERPADEQDAEGLPGERDGLGRDDDLRAEGDDGRPEGDEDDVPDPGAEPFADRDRDQEIAEGQAALGGRAAIESRDGDGHQGSAGGSHCEATDARESSTASDGAVPGSRGRPVGLLVADGADDRQAAGQTGRIGRGEDRQDDAQDEGDGDGRPRQGRRVGQLDRRRRRP